MKDILEMQAMIDAINDMDYNKRENLLYFINGILYGLGWFDTDGDGPDDDATYEPVKPEEPDDLPFDKEGEDL